MTAHVKLSESTKEEMWLSVVTHRRDYTPKDLRNRIKAALIFDTNVHSGL